MTRVHFAGDPAVPPYFVVIRGPLGIGKTTVARRLAGELNAEVIEIDPILEEWEWDGGSESLFLRANRVAGDRAQALLNRGIPVILDGNFYWQSALKELANRLDFPSTVFSLKAPVEVCIRRDAARAHSFGPESTREVFEKTERFDYGISIDANRPVETIVRDLLNRLRAEELAKGEKLQESSGPRTRPLDP